MAFSLSYFGKRKNNVDRKSKNRDVLAAFKKRQLAKKAKKKEKKKLSVSQQTPKRKFNLEALEPRLLLSADLAFGDSTALDLRLNDQSNFDPADDVFELVDNSNVVIDSAFRDILDDRIIVTGSANDDNLVIDFNSVGTENISFDGGLGSDAVSVFADEEIVLNDLSLTVADNTYSLSSVEDAHFSAGLSTLDTSAFSGSVFLSAKILITTNTMLPPTLTRCFI